MAVSRVERFTQKNVLYSLSYGTLIRMQQRDGMIHDYGYLDALAAADEGHVIAAIVNACGAPEGAS
jgi:hypothetical protein